MVKFIFLQNKFMKLRENLSMTIVVLGLSCSGKSTFSNKLGKLLNLEVFHLDSYYWESPWIVDKTFDINDFVEKENSIIDGNYFNYAFTERLDYCDCIIYIDCNIFVRIFRMIKRHITYCLTPKKKNAVSQKINFYFVFITIYKQIYLQPKIIQYLKNNYHQKLVYIKNIRSIHLEDENV